MITIRPTTIEDAQILADIQKQAFWPLYERYRDQSNPCLRGVEDVAKRLDSSYFRYFTIVYDGEIAGGLLYKCAGRGIFFDQLSQGEYYLQRVYIRPALQCRKIAQTAILLCEKEFPDARSFSVDFPEDLIKNRKCYEAAGFRDTGKRKEVEPGLVLAYYLKKLE